MEWIEDIEEILSSFSFFPIIEEEWNGCEYHHPLDTIAIYEIYREAICN
jgi:hypothetical protein